MKKSAFHLLFIVGTIFTPFLLLMIAVMAVFSPWFLGWEYNKSNFPPDTFGFSTEERIYFGGKTLDYILYNQKDETLAKITVSNGETLYTSREQSHMVDVKNVFRNCKNTFFLTVVFYCALLFASYKNPVRFAQFFLMLKKGSILTLSLLSIILFFTFAAFDTLFTLFHKLFFSDGTWLFYLDDALIRLFPEKLWIDGFICTAILTIVLASVLWIVSHRTHQKIKVK